MASVLMPRLSDSMEEGTIVRWLVGDGALVAAGEELAEIETDKAVMTYEAESAGVLAILADAGATVAVGAPIAELAAEGARAPRRPAQGDAERIASAPRRAYAARARVSPVARRIAAETGVDLLALTGSGPAGRIVKRDVLAAAAAPRHPVVESRAEQGAPSAGRGAMERQALSRVQQTIARRMAEAKATQPEFTLTLDVDMSAALELRERLKASAAQQDLRAPSLNDLVVRAVATALRAHPRANGAYRHDRFELYERVNVGFAVAAPGTLLVPVVHDADTLSIGAIAARTATLATRARDGALTPSDLADGTFTVSNLGMFGIDAFTAILNTPQAGILAVGAVRDVPVAQDGEIRAGKRMTATLTCDHRILYGVDAAAFLADVRRGLEDPIRLIL